MKASYHGEIATMNSYTPFHNSVETGLRSLIALYEAAPSFLSFERLHHYDYISVHTADFSGPESLHTNFPDRAAEFLVRRDLIKEGLELLLAKGLIKLEFTKKGIMHTITDEGACFLHNVESPYIGDLKTRVKWVHQEFHKHSDIALKKIFQRSFKTKDNPFEFQQIIRKK